VSHPGPARRSVRTVLVANPGADIYGSDLQLLESVTALVQAGMRVVVAITEEGPLVARLQEREAEVRVGRFPVLRRAFATPAGIAKLAASAAAAMPRLVSLIRQVRPAAVYVNTTTLPWWLTAARLTRVPAVCHVHEAEEQDSRAVRLALTAPLLQAHRLILISRTALEATCADLSGLRDKAVLVHNGVPDRPTPPVPIPPADDGYRVAVVGRLSPRKAPDVALRAVAALRRTGRDVRIEIAGSAFPGYDWYTDELRALAAGDDLAGAVTFTGYADPIWSVLDHAHAVLAPSLREPFGNAVVEAQLSARPVIASAAAGHLETVEDGRTGIQVPVGDPGAMAEALGDLIDDPARAASLGATARTEALAQFGIERYRRQIADIVTEL
jgi:glycosyltransferase involved in cell wall biosynthesis